MNNLRRQSGFTLIEMLVVIAILGILTALTVPALKSLGKSNVSASASRQLLDDVGRARQLAISDHTTVYMIFVPTNFWQYGGNVGNSYPPSSWWNQLTPTEKAAGTNLLDKQFTGYNFISLRSVGDQPGQGKPRYLADKWQNLPQGSFIAAWKFQRPSAPPYYISSYNPTVPIYGFNTNNIFPFPTATNNLTFVNQNIALPYIAFNYLGQLTVDGVNLAQNDEYIPLAQGSVLPALNGSTKIYTLGSPTISETPTGNSTNTAFNLVHIDRLTGRATLESFKLQ